MLALPGCPQAGKTKHNHAYAQRNVISCKVEICAVSVYWIIEFGFKNYEQAADCQYSANKSHLIPLFLFNHLLFQTIAQIYYYL
jgi:hypothetical protein